MNINGHEIGGSNPVYIVAEMSANHNQEFDKAVELVHAAKKAGADAVKLQTYTPDTITLDSDKDDFLIGEGTLWSGRRLHELYAEASTPWEWMPRLIDVAHELAIDMFSSPFDPTAVDFLETIDVPAYKIASFEIVDTPLIEYVAGKGKPMIMSTGMATLAEIDDAVTAALRGGAEQISLLKCCSAYPAPMSEMNLQTIPHLSQAFGVPVGLSDHTLGTAVPIAAVALGASIVEKHFTLTRSIEGPDSAFSLEPDEFKAMVDGIRSTEQALGKVRYGIGDQESTSRKFRRSLFAVKDIEVGQTFTRENVRSIRPGNGLHPKHLNNIIGRVSTVNIERGTPLDWDIVR